MSNIGKYPHKTLEKKWQEAWNKRNAFKSKKIGSKKKIYFRNVSISFWKYSHGTC